MSILDTVINIEMNLIKISLLELPNLNLKVNKVLMLYLIYRRMKKLIFLYMKEEEDVFEIDVGNVKLFPIIYIIYFCVFKFSSCIKYSNWIIVQ